MLAEMDVRLRRVEAKVAISFPERERLLVLVHDHVKLSARLGRYRRYFIQATELRTKRALMPVAVVIIIGNRRHPNACDDTK